MMWDVHDLEAEGVELPRPPAVPGLPPGKPLELLVHKRKLILFESNCLHVWDIDSLAHQATIHHRKEADGDAGSASAAPHLEVQWMGDHVVTWERGVSKQLKIWDLSGETVAVLQSPRVLLQLDVARVTWGDCRDLSHFLLASMDSSSTVTIWDTRQNFGEIFSLQASCSEPFDLVLTQDFLATVNDNVAENCLEITFWKLWFHPTSSNTPARDPRVKSKQKIRVLKLADIDSYFASYRNFFNVCSYHKNGLESLHVYRSNSLKKRVFFPPAKHTKFEEWLALQVHAGGDVSVYDFRPDGRPFDALLAGDDSTTDAAYPRDHEATCPESHRMRSSRDGHRKSA